MKDWWIDGGWVEGGMNQRLDSSWDGHTQEFLGLCLIMTPADGCFVHRDG